MQNYSEIISFIRTLYSHEKGTVPLHAPFFGGNEKKYLNECIDSTFVSYKGEFVDRLESKIMSFTKANSALAIVNGTAALHTALMLADVRPGDIVLVPALTFVATVNAVSYCGAEPYFIDCDKDNLGLSPEKLEDFLRTKTSIGSDGHAYLKTTAQKVTACIPVHIFGHPAKIQSLTEICHRYGIFVIEDAAESLGSYVGGQHTGLFGDVGVFSFNGNKTVTCGGGGALITNNQKLEERARHLSTTAKLPHAWDFLHDEVGYNYRLPNLNAAVACAQFEQLDTFLKNKRETAEMYAHFFEKMGIPFLKEAPGCRANYWLNAILLSDEEQKLNFLNFSNQSGIATRPLWKAINKLPMYQKFGTTNLDNTQYFEERLVNIPSSVRLLQ